MAIFTKNSLKTLDLQMTWQAILWWALGRSYTTWRAGSQGEVVSLSLPLCFKGTSRFGSNSYNTGTDAITHRE